MSWVLCIGRMPYDGCMVYGMKRMVRLAVFLIAVWMGFVTASWAVTFGYAEEAEKENIAAVTVTAEAVDPACGEWAVCLSHSLYELAGERDLALLVTVEAAEAAFASRRPVRVFSGSGEVHGISFVRNYLKKDGGACTNPSPDMRELIGERLAENVA